MVAMLASWWRSPVAGVRSFRRGRKALNARVAALRALTEGVT
jgi:hypothetical protein